METKLKANFTSQVKHEPFYTGGKIQFNSDGDQMFCQCGEQVHIVEVATGKTQDIISNDEGDPVTCFAVSPDDSALVIASQSLQLKQWQQTTLKRTWKAIHTAPISCMAFDVTSTLLATGGADSTIKVWDIIKQYCTHNLRGHQGVVSVVCFHPDISRLLLLSGADDGHIRVWSLANSMCVGDMAVHVSRVTAMQLYGDLVYTAARDNVINICNLDTMQKVRTIPVYESVEGLVLLHDLQPLINVTEDFVHLVTAGEKGLLRVFNSQTSTCVFTQQHTSSVEQAFVDLSHCDKTGTLNAVTYDHNIIMYNEADLTINKQFIGYNDQVLDMKLVGNDESHVAVATNSAVIRVFELSTWSCQVLHGHTDVVLALDVGQQGAILVSSSKDRSVRIWRLDCGRFNCIAVGNGHMNAVAAVAFARLNAAFVVSGSEDLTIKLWPLKIEQLVDEPVSLHAQVTERAHDRDINAVTVSPNDQLLATVSQDKTAKLWKLPELSLIGVLRGHKRAIWCVQFSPVDQCIATGAADGSVRLWALSDLTCVKTFDGEASVLRLSFLSRGMQLITSTSDGLLKLWTIKSNECIKTIDAHDDKVWALTVNKQEDKLLSGAGDSNIIVWKDVTEEERQEQKQKQEEILLKEQELSNLLLQKKYVKAIGLALTLDQPYRLLAIIKEVLSGNAEELSCTLEKLRDDQIDALLGYAVTWNMNSRHCHVAQTVLGVLLRSWPPDQLSTRPALREAVEALIPYTERHASRMDRLLQQTMFVAYTWNCMRPSSTAQDKDVAKQTKYSMQQDNTSAETKDNANQDQNSTATTISKKVKKRRRRKSSSMSEMSIEGQSESLQHTDVVEQQNVPAVVCINKENKQRQNTEKNASSKAVEHTTKPEEAVTKKKSNQKHSSSKMKPAKRPMNAKSKKMTYTNLKRQKTKL